MAKKKPATKKHILTNSTHIMLKKSLGLYAALVFVLFVLLSISGFTVVQYGTSRINNQRLHRIEAIYGSLDLGTSYRGVHSNVFGDKRIYSWDKGRSASSSIEYTHNDTPANTRADLGKKIIAAGFVRVGGAYEGSPEPQDHYKNSSGEYIRVATASKYVQDAMTYGPLSKDDPLVNHKDESPTYVTIKVNLDDNNE